jgi:hypothetical protein
MIVKQCGFHFTRAIFGLNRRNTWSARLLILYFMSSRSGAENDREMLLKSILGTETTVLERVHTVTGG